MENNNKKVYSVIPFNMDNKTQKMMAELHNLVSNDGVIEASALKNERYNLVESAHHLGIEMNAAYRTFYEYYLVKYGFDGALNTVAFRIGYCEWCNNYSIEERRAAAVSCNHYMTTRLLEAIFSEEDY